MEPGYAKLTYFLVRVKANTVILGLYIKSQPISLSSQFFQRCII